jgi:hypothetical protein
MVRIGESEANKINDREISKRKTTKAPAIEMHMCVDCNKEFLGDLNFQKHLNTATHKKQVDKNNKKVMKGTPKKKQQQNDYVELGEDDDSDFD